MGTVDSLANKRIKVEIDSSAKQYPNQLTLPPINVKSQCYGREKDITYVFNHLEKNKPLVIKGIGGIGKTQLCKYIYAQVIQQNSSMKFDHVAWVNYHNNIMESFFDAFSSNLAISTDLKNEKRFEILLSKLNSLAEEKDILIIVDNIDHFVTDDCKISTLTQLCCYVVVTSRLELMQRNIYSLGLLNPNASETFFLHNYNYEYTDRDTDISTVLPNLVHLCGYHAMTIELLAKSLNVGAIKISGAYQLLIENHFDLSVFTEQTTTEWNNETTDASISEHIGKLFDILNLSFEEKEILHIISFFAPINFPVADLLRILGEKKKPSALTQIIKKGWISDENNVINMHASVKFSVLNRYKTDVLDKYTYLLKNLSELLVWENSYSEITNLIHHAESVFITFQTSPSSYLILLASKISEYYFYKGNFQLSIDYLIQQIEILKLFPNSNKDVARCFQKIGAQYQELGATDMAYDYHIKCLKLRKQCCLPDSFERSECYAHIAFCYQEMGQYWKAISNAKCSLKIRLHLYGADHEKTAWSYNNLALLYYYMFEYDQALEFINCCLRIREKIVKEDQTDIIKHKLDFAQSKSIRGLIYQALGKLDCAYIDQNESLNIRIEYLGKEHIFTATSYCRIASLLCSQADFRDLDLALDYAEKAIKFDKNTSGDYTIDIAEAYMAKARVLRFKEEYYESIALFQLAVQIIQTIYDKKHPRLSKILEELGDVYKEFNNLKQTKICYQRSYEIRTLFLPNGHWALQDIENKINSL